MPKKNLSNVLIGDYDMESLRPPSSTQYRNEFVPATQDSERPHKIRDVSRMRYNNLASHSDTNNNYKSGLTPKSTSHGHFMDIVEKSGMPRSAFPDAKFITPSEWEYPGLNALYRPITRTVEYQTDNNPTTVAHELFHNVQARLNGNPNPTLQRQNDTLAMIRNLYAGGFSHPVRTSSERGATLAEYPQYFDFGGSADSIKAVASGKYLKPFKNINGYNPDNPQHLSDANSMAESRIKYMIANGLLSEQPTILNTISDTFADLPVTLASLLGGEDVGDAWWTALSPSIPKPLPLKRIPFNPNYKPQR